MRLAARIADLLARRRDLYGINRRNVELVYRHNARRDYPIADDKLLFKTLMEDAGVPVPRTLAVCDGLMGIPAALEAVARRDDFVVKPANGSGGRGILVVAERVAAGRWRRAGGETIDVGGLRRHLASIVFGTFSDDLEDRAFVEERLVPHPVLRQMWPDGLCDVRIITLLGRPVLGMLRVPTRKSGGRANLHQGGLGLAIDVETGRTVRVVREGRELDRHPDSGMPLLGIQLPSWPELLDVAHRVAGAVPLGYLGVDIVVDDNGRALVLEINARPGLEIQNVHRAGLGSFLREGSVA